MPAKHSKKALPKRTSSAKATPAAQETRLALMNAAQTHFSESGFKAASVHKIAKDAGVNVSLVSYHFGGKEGLFKACLERAGVDRLEIAERILNTDPTSLEEVKIRLSMFIDEILIDSIKNPEICTILNRDLHSEFHLIADVFQKTFLSVFELLTKFLQHAKDRKILSDWIDPHLSAVQMMGGVIHMTKTDEIRLKLFNSTISDPETRIYTRDYLLKTHLEGLWNRDSQK